MSMKYTEVCGFNSIREELDYNGTFRQLGAVRFDRDLRAVMAYLTSQTIFGDIREKFIRLQQISTLLNLDSVCNFIPFGVYASLPDYRMKM